MCHSFKKKKKSFVAQWVKKQIDSGSIFPFACLESIGETQARGYNNAEISLACLA